jgi:hypothetical protein
MALNTLPRCYYFTAETLISDEEREEMESLDGFRVHVRNGAFVGPHDRPEGNPAEDYVAGSIPDAYKGYKHAADKPKREPKKKAVKSETPPQGSTPPAGTWGAQG